MMMVEVDAGSPAMDFDDLWGNVELPSDFSQDSELDNLRFNDALTGVQTSEEIPGSSVVSPQNKLESLEAKRAYSDGFVECGWNSGVVNGGTVEHSSYISQGNDLFCRHEVLWTEDQISGFGGVPPEDNFETSVSWRACSDGSRGPSWESVFPYCEMLVPSSWTSQGNGLFDMHADGGSQNAPSCKNDNEKAPCEVQNHRERFNFDVSNHDFHEQSLEKNRGDKAPFETRSYGETPFLHGFDHVIHMQDSSDFSHLKLQNDLVGITGYYAMTSAGNELNEPSNTLPNDYSKIQGHIKVKKNIDVIPSGDIVSRDSEIVDGAIYGGPHVPSSSKYFPLDSCKNYGLHSEDEAEEKIFESRRALPPLSVAGGTPVKRSVTAAHYQHSALHVSELPGIMPPPSVEVESEVLKTENEVSKSKDGCLLKINLQGVQNNTCCQSNVNNDSDLCILENMSAPAPSYRIATSEKLGTSKILTLSSPGNQIVTTNSRRKPNNERVIFRVALQDLSQPKSEATPPDGVLSVPLLKHQRIALSWMANKETKSACCAGGILADDQGLGKTISTIALILKERPPSSKAPRTNVKQSETETLNLDDDIDDVSGAEGAELNGCPINSGIKIPLPAKGRPSGGTLIVCPTSVLRQWSEELHSKVTGKAYLSVLVYYGSNRTKDPLELAKYDVVVTTYAIVTMEVPKQPVVNESDDQMGSYKDSPSCGKRKIIDAISDRKSSMSKKSRRGIDNESLENVSGPLAQVRWFRVVLDEAQSIKNHRTQVARACWGLRAKRRWCLSGTPIQNAIDDLYSYFRFLRHEPYAVFRTFCEQVKVPIHRNPRNGYKKLQAVLKTVMLRRTKAGRPIVMRTSHRHHPGDTGSSSNREGSTQDIEAPLSPFPPIDLRIGTLIDGQPIINLPPKTIQLRKIDFSKEERDFYSRLEADSRAQFAEYAAAGTVKQNYVNILLMLLRLRQACDHPLLVKGLSSRSKIHSSIEVAKKLSREKQNFLLSCLEASLAICGVCNDPPEDAVVTVCGHVFCNQCICEHITGDDTQCPTKKCKTHLTKSCVFSTTTLRMALSDQPSTETTANSQVAGPHALSCPQDSSKIRAALDILSSLTKPQDSSEKLYSPSEEMNRESGGVVKGVGEKAIVFSQWTGMLDLLEACLKSSSIQYRRLDGTMAVAARDRAIKDFTSLPEVSVMIMSLKAASLGLNMVAACNVLLLDLWWNPTTEDQAIDRAHRIGQTRPVSVFRLTVKDTVEDRILALQQKKRKMVAYAFGEDKSGSRQSRLTVEDLKYLFRVE